MFKKNPLWFTFFLFVLNMQADLHVSVQFFQQCRVPLESGEGFAQTGCQSQDPRRRCPLGLHVFTKLLTAMPTNEGSSFLHTKF